MRNVPLTALLALASSSCAIPSRDNDHDPANIGKPPIPQVAVLVGTADSVLESTVGERHSRWVLDGSGSLLAGGGPLPASACFEWSLSSEPGDDPASIDDAAWRPLGTCASALLDTEADTDAADAFHEVSGFDNGTPVPDGTGVAPRWVRLTLRAGGGAASIFKLLTVVNDAPVVALGADRRTAPGGRWWETGPDVAFQNVIVARIDDPDPVVSVRWGVSGELAARVDADGDGFVDAAYVSTDGTAVTLPMSLDPSRSVLTAEARDFAFDDGGTLAKPGVDSVRLDVLTTVWVFNEGTGHLRYLDSSQFGSDVNDVSSRVVAIAGGKILTGRNDSPGVVEVMQRDRGLAAPPDLVLDENFNSEDMDFVAGASDGNGGWWLQSGEPTGGFLIHLSSAMVADFVVNDIALTAGYNDFASGNGGRDSAIVPGAGTRIWAVGGENLNGTAGEYLFLLNDNGTLAVTPVVAFSDGSAVTALVADGGGGVWAGTNTDTLSHVSAAGGRTEHALPPECPGTVLSLAFDVVAQVLWLGMNTPDANTETLCRIPADDFNTVTTQSVNSVGPIAVDPLNGDALMIANGATGISRYHALSAASVDYIPMSPGTYAEDLWLMDGSLVVNVAPAFQQHRMVVVEGGEIFVPNNVVLGVDPYLFEEVRHVSDPVTGFVWVWRPDDAVIAAYSPAGETLLEVPIPVAREKRGQLAFDAGSRRVWFSFSDLYTGNNFPDPTGRLYWFDVPDDFAGPVTTSSSATVQIAISRALGALPGEPGAPGRLCFAANLAGESLTDAVVRMIGAEGTQTAEAAVSMNGPSQDNQMWAVPDPASGDCYFAKDGFDIEVLRFRTGAAAESIAHGGRTLYEPVFVGAGEGWSIAVGPQCLAKISTTDVTDVLDPDFDDAVDVFAIGSGTVDPYWKHAWIGFGVPGDPSGGQVVRMTLGDAPTETARFLGFDRPQLENGR